MRRWGAGELLLFFDSEASHQTKGTSLLNVVMIAASTIDGRIGPSFVSSSLDRRLLETMRAGTDASLMGAETLRQGDPEMRGPGSVLPSSRIRAVISMSGIIPGGEKIFKNGPKPVIFTSFEKLKSLSDRLGDSAHCLAVPADRHGLSITVALDELGRLGVRSLLVEGGGRLNYACLSEGVINEIRLTLCPHFSGDGMAASLVNGKGSLTNLSLHLVSCEPALSGEIFLRYKVTKKVIP